LNVTSILRQRSVLMLVVIVTPRMGVLWVIITPTLLLLGVVD
jgi:hypothetical protein